MIATLLETHLREEAAAYRERAQQAEEDLRRVKRAATGTTWKLRNNLKRAEARIRQLEKEAMSNGKTKTAEAEARGAASGDAPRA